MREKGILSDQKAKSNARKVINLGKKLEEHEMAEMKMAHHAKHHKAMAKHHEHIAHHHHKMAESMKHAKHEGAKHHKAHHRAK